jgi:hypothetical protein
VRTLLCALALAALAGGCGDDEGAGADAGTPAPGSPPATSPTATATATTAYPGEPSLPDPGGERGPPDIGPLDVADALRRADGTRVTVAGRLIALPDGTATLCGGPIRESAPPQCGEPSLPVDGLDDAVAVPGATEVGGWIEGDVELTGTVRSGRLDVGA